MATPHDFSSPTPMSGGPLPPFEGAEPARVRVESGNGSAVASLVLGIVSIFLCTFWGVPSLVCGPLAIYFGRKYKRSVGAGLAPVHSLGIAKAGYICGIIGTILGAVGLLLIVAYFVVVVTVLLPTMAQTMPQPNPPASSAASETAHAQNDAVITPEEGETTAGDSANNERVSEQPEVDSEDEQDAP
ncbi:MAG: DUF4190 domain-containing protein [Planctomycetota bacterium]